MVELTLHLSGESADLLFGNGPLLQHTKVLRTLYETALNCTHQIARNRTGAASWCDIACLRCKVVHKVEVMGVLFKVISSTVGKYSRIEDVSFSDAPSVEA